MGWGCGGKWQGISCDNEGQEVILGGVLGWWFYLGTFIERVVVRFYYW